MDEFILIAVDGIRAFADSRDVRVVVEAAASLPEVRVDLDRMVQVMTNLLSNAIKFSPPGNAVRVEQTTSAGPWRLRHRPRPGDRTHRPSPVVSEVPAA